MRGDYLFYEEKIETTPEEKEAKAARRCVFPPFTLGFSRLTSTVGLDGRLTRSQRLPLPFEDKTGHLSQTVSRSRHIPRMSTHVAVNRHGSGT